MLSENFPSESNTTPETEESQGALPPERLLLEVITEGVIEELVYVDRIAFEGIRVELSLEEVKKILENPKAVHLVIKNNQMKIVGYLTSLPQNQSYTYLAKADLKMGLDDSALYIESMAILPTHRSFKNFNSMLRKIIAEAGISGYTCLTMHARVSNHLTDVLQKRYRAEFVHRVDNFYGTSEAFDYLKLDLKSLK